MSFTKRGVLAASFTALALVATTALAGCSSSNGGGTDGGDTEAESQLVRIGVVGIEDYWSVFEAAAEAEIEGLDVEIVDLAEYPIPNPALTDGEIDLNQFQHIIYLAEHNNATGDTLQPIGSTAIYPLGLYSKQYESVEDIPDGETVAIPDDATNGARGLLVLQSAGLIELKDGGSPVSTIDDVIEEDSRVKVTTLAAAFTATSLDDVAAAIINNDFVEDAGLSFEDAIAQDDPSDPAAFPYVNIWVSTEEEKDNELYLRLVEIYQTNEEVQEGVLEASGGTAEFVRISAEELQQSLIDTQAAFK